ncbi:hypothetical protein [Geminocystis sp. GBBB08]|uniref:hypothetical protein n=1 Tax=Geminocystis sp. GBBB08 TaxID=2604140 RepID=UPI0027E28409|nr:hypothetical protein [Geminocystis sp. GBBB08]MBL1208972.1 hypothetical protein [Geminocystis sp. GBBB08]
MTPMELKEKGYQVLVKELGQFETLKFLQEMGWGFGDYTKERQKSLQNITRQQFWEDVKQLRKEEN